MSTIGAVARSVYNPPHEARARLDAEAERKRIYYVALYAEMERCRVAQVPMLIGADLDYGIPRAPTGGKVVRVRFRGASTSDNILDFATLTDGVSVPSHQSTSPNSSGYDK